LGSGLPLLLAITIGMRWLPKPGNWMQSVNRIFGYALLATAIIVLRPILQGSLLLGLWAAWVLAVAVQFSINQQPSWRFVSRYLALLLSIWGGIMLLGSATGGDDPLQPLANLNLQTGTAATGQHSMQRFADVEQLQAQLKQAQQDGKWVLLDFYADWCVSCKVMEKSVFAKTAVQQALADMRLLQADVTLNTAQQQQLMHDLQIMGPPTILFIDPQGTEQRTQRITGEVSASEFLLHLASAQKDH